MRLSQQHGPGFPRRNETGVRVAGQAQRAAGIGTEDPGERAESLPLVGDRITAAHRGPLRIAQQRSQPAVLNVRPPRHADVGCDVIPVSLVAAVTARELLEYRHRAAARARIVEVAGAVGATVTDAGDATNRG